ncbi:hypothetical protein ANN_15632 [Periplaneta americana]|uniref:Uncharacterized protein n=1 Tax=Periplaneta americana TaxID=6978 RepID=A0ABQ8SHB0_PERAM|nr:hypothetical protein ANN_15632 [Periplaneta americana]
MLQFFDVFVMQFHEENAICSKDRIRFFIMTIPQHIGRSCHHIHQILLQQIPTCFQISNPYSRDGGMRQPKGENSCDLALREVTKDGLQDCFEKWYGRWKKCVTTQGAAIFSYKPEHGADDTTTTTTTNITTLTTTTTTTVTTTVTITTTLTTTTTVTTTTITTTVTTTTTTVTTTTTNITTTTTNITTTTLTTITTTLLLLLLLLILLLLYYYYCYYYYQYYYYYYYSYYYYYYYYSYYCHY